MSERIALFENLLKLETQCRKATIWGWLIPPIGLSHTNHLHMVHPLRCGQGRDDDDYTPDETPKTPKTPKSARTPNNRINLPKEFPMLGWQNRQQSRRRPLRDSKWSMSLDFGITK